MNRRRLFRGLLTLLLFSVGACALMQRDPGPVLITTANLPRLQGLEWELRGMNIDGNDIVMHVDAKMGLLFNADGMVQGQGGVNQFAGTYRIGEDGKLAWGANGFVTTRKAGAPEFLDKEKIYLAALGRTTRAIAGKYMLTLQSENAEVVLTFLRPGTL